MPSSDSAQDDRVRDFRSPRGLIALWFAVLVGPLAWAAGLTAAYSLVHTACARGTMLPLHLVSLVTLLVDITYTFIDPRIRYS